MMCCSMLHGPATVVHFLSRILTHFILFKGKRIMKLATIYHNVIQLIPHFGIKRGKNSQDYTNVLRRRNWINFLFCRGFQKVEGVWQDKN